MRIVRWGAAATAALAASVPFAAQAATTSTTNTTTSGSTVKPVGTATQKVSTAVSTVPTTQPATTSGSNTTSGTASQSTTQDTVTTTPAPAGSSEGYAANLGGVVSVSHTKANASGDGPSSTADPLEIGGKPPASVFGGSKAGDGNGSGALLDTGTQPFGRIALTPWTVSNSSSASGNSASGLADIVLVDLGNPATPESITLRVLQSKSDANWNSSESTSSTSTDGAILDVGGPSGLVVDLLHSQSSSSGAGSSYLVSVNGTPIGTSDQANGKCVLNLPGLLQVECLTASGGTGATGVLTSTGGVGSVTLGSGGNSLTGGVLQSSSSSGKAPASTSPGSGSGSGTGTGTGSGTGAGTGTGSGTPTAAPAGPGAVSATAHKLAFTGGEIIPTVVTSAGLLGGGALLVGASRRRRRRQETGTV